MANNSYRIGIDLGGTKIAGTILDHEGNEIFAEGQRPRRDTEQEKGYANIVDKIVSLYDELREHINNAPHTFGIGTPGAVSRKTGLLKNSNTVCLNSTPLQQDLSERLSRAVVIENDANCFAMAEAKSYPGKVVFGVIMGTGCGGGIVVNNQVITGLQSIGGEWGHHTIAPKDGPYCYCGKRGCIETLISGGGLQNRFHERFRVPLTVKQIFALAKKSDNYATTFVDEFYDNFGIAMSNLIAILDPDVVVLGGGLSNVDELYTIGRERVRKYIFSDELETPIVKNIYGDSAGVIGAALIGR
jgi:fructokinase